MDCYFVGLCCVVGEVDVFGVCLVVGGIVFLVGIGYVLVIVGGEVGIVFVSFGYEGFVVGIDVVVL